jgi:riboflavin synthase
MFTGIVEELGTVRRGGRRLAVEARTAVEDSTPGSSMAVNGVCLTVIEREDSTDGRPGATLWFDVSEETAARSSLGKLRAGDPVNLERPVTLLTRLGGHLVQGHVDGVGQVAAVEEEPGRGRRMMVKVPDDLRRYVVEKGSIAVDGVSLTVSNLDGDRFGVALIPHTLEATTLGGMRPGDSVNLEVDVLAKYVEGLIRRMP